MEDVSKQKFNKPGRKPKSDPCTKRFVFYLNESDGAVFDSMFLKTGLRKKAYFIESIIFSRPVRIIKIDKATSDYFMRLTNIYSQYQSVGVNYNQVVKALKTNFSEKRAFVLLKQLEKLTAELVEISKKIIELTMEFEKKHLGN